MEGMQEVTGVIPVDLWGVARRELVLRYAITDPAAVQLQVNGGSWCVARQRLLTAIGPAQPVLDEAGDEGAAAVQLSRLPGVCSEYVRLVLRTACRCWAMVMRADDLAEFLAHTYAACSTRREQDLVDAALGGQLELIAATGGRS